ncbi:hypothetical protein BDW22DRAFT_563551 [Trametopsis cervina]|nr:hypothetical protein BDW22DRAFT_563551 [Trametopsis cervina]
MPVKSAAKGSRVYNKPNNDRPPRICTCREKVAQVARGMLRTPDREPTNSVETYHSDISVLIPACY